jgi:hypothetical protein
VRQMLLRLRLSWHGFAGFGAVDIKRQWRRGILKAIQLLACLLGPDC